MGSHKALENRRIATLAADQAAVMAMIDQREAMKATSAVIQQPVSRMRQHCSHIGVRLLVVCLLFVGACVWNVQSCTLFGHGKQFENLIYMLFAFLENTSAS